MIYICDENIKFGSDVEYWEDVKKFIEENGEELEGLKYFDNGVFVRNSCEDFKFNNDIEVLKKIDNKIDEWVEKFGIDEELVCDRFWYCGDDGDGSLEFREDGIEGVIRDFDEEFDYVISVKKNGEMGIIEVNFENGCDEKEYKEGSKGFERVSKKIREVEI